MNIERGDSFVVSYHIPTKIHTTYTLTYGNRNLMYISVSISINIHVDPLFQCDKAR